MNNNKLNLILSFLFISILVSGSFFYYQIDKFNKPYEIIEALINDAETNIELSAYVKSNKEKNEFNWDNFKRIINKQEFNYISYQYQEDYPLKEKILNADRNQAEVNIYFYDAIGNEVGHKRILLEKIDKSWKAVSLKNWTWEANFYYCTTRKNSGRRNSGGRLWKIIYRY